MCGLAKRLEEVWVPEQEDPIIFPRTSEALYLLQRLRDEAHRFAITYHRAKRSKSMTVSALDNVPGLGEVRRKALVRHFGSVAALRRAAVERSCRCPGVGRAHRGGGGGRPRAVRQRAEPRPLPARDARIGQKTADPGTCSTAETSTTDECDGAVPVISGRRSSPGCPGPAGRTAAKCLEDMGWFVVDNLPPELIATMVDLGVAHQR